MQKNFVLKAQKAIKRIAAISTATTMLGATILGAVAAQDLGDYPTPFISESGALNGLVVVGAAAQSADVIGAAELVSTLTQAAVTTVAGTSSTTVTGGKSKDVNLGDTLTSDFNTAALDDNDLSGFQDTEIDFGDSTYNVHDALYLSANKINVSTSESANDDNYGSNVAIELKKSGIKYYYVFDEAVNVSTATSSEPLEMSFLGKTIKITSVTDANTFTAQVGDSYFVNVGDSVTVNGKVVTLNDVSSTSTCTVSVDVDGVSETVSTTSERVNGIKIEADDCFYSDTKSDRSASLIIGEDTSKTYNDGDPYIGQDDNHPDWRWDLGGLNKNAVGTTSCTTSSTGACIGVVSDMVKDDWKDNPIQVGESYDLPNDYASVKFDSLTSNDYMDLTFEIETGVDLNDTTTGNGVAWGTSNSVLSVTSNTDDTLVLSSSGFGTTGSALTSQVSTDTIYFYLDQNSAAVSNVSVFYLDNSNDLTYAGQTNISSNFTVGWVDFKDSTGSDHLPLKILNDATNRVKFYVADGQATATGGSVITMNWTTSGTTFASLGSSADTEEASELMYGTTSVGTKDEDHRTHYGIIIQDPKSNGASDKVTLSIPGDVLEATVIISGPGTTTTTSGGSVNVVSVAGTAVAKLDTEISDATAKNLILVGGPAVNKLTASALGLDFPTYGAASTIPENKGMLKLVSSAFGGSNTALVVAGWTADDTRNAANVLKNYADYSAQLSGKTEVEVSGTTVTAVSSSTNVE